MALSAITSAQQHFPLKRSAPVPDDVYPSKRARLEYILCDSGENSVFSIPLHTLTNTQHHPSTPDLHPQFTGPSTTFEQPLPYSHSDPNSLYNVRPEQTNHPSSRDPDLTPSLPNPLVDKFTKSRAVGQSHRDNEKEHVNALRIDVEKCRDENILLFALFSASYKLEHCKPLPLRLIADVHARLAHDLPEDYNVLNDDDAQRRGLIKLSDASAKLLEQRYISPTLAVILLDFVVYRRNLINVTSDTDEPGYRRRKRRSAYRIALSKTNAEELVDFAVSLFVKEDRGNEHPDTYIDRRLGALSVLVDKWSDSEAKHDPPNLLDDTTEPAKFPPKSPTRPEAAEFGSPRRRGEGAKRCSRCNMVKFTGSGHGRSKCDDGYSISSRVPYRGAREPESSPNSECTSAEGGNESSVLSN